MKTHLEKTTADLVHEGLLPLRIRSPNLLNQVIQPFPAFTLETREKKAGSRPKRNMVVNIEN